MEDDLTEFNLLQKSSGNWANLQVYYYKYK